jgi:hypothetical protein
MLAAGEKGMNKLGEIVNKMKTVLYAIRIYLNPEP